MPQPSHVVIDRIDWKSVLPVLRLASAFKHALQPGKLVVALVAVLAIHFSGTVLDLIWGDPVESVGGQAGVYDVLLNGSATSMVALFESAVELRGGLGDEFGVTDVLSAPFNGALAWMIRDHPWFMLLFGIDVLFVLAMSSGILTRMSASQVCQNKITPLPKAACSVCRRWVWYLLTPLMPAMLVVVVAAVLALVGLVFFNIPGLDVIGSLGYGMFLFLGFVIAIVAVLLLLALVLIPPALSVEGGDGFDAIARSFNYILFRPWQFGAYLLSSILYLAIVSVLVSTVTSLAVDATTYSVELGAVATASEQYVNAEYVPESEHITLDMTRHQAILANADNRGSMISASSWIMARWFEFASAIVAAILFSTFCCLQTQVYVLLRRSADGTPMDQCDGDEKTDLWAAPSTNTSALSPTDQANHADTAKDEG